MPYNSGACVKHISKEAITQRNFPSSLSEETTAIGEAVILGFQHGNDVLSCSEYFALLSVMDDVQHIEDHDGSFEYDNSPSQLNAALIQLPATTNPPGPDNPPRQQVWLIFGARGHTGRSLARAALDHGDKVCSVGRTFEDTLESMYKCHRDDEHYLGLLCDVRIPETVKSAFEKARKHFGRVDIIVNCSGYGVIGSCEDQDEYEIRNQFETNFMGTLNIIQSSLPYFRERQQGRYLIFSSTSGALGVPGLGPYCATKYAVEGLIESMLYEIDAFNIKATLVEPGHMRRDDVTDNGSKLPIFGHFKVARASEPYEGKDAPAAHAKRMLQWLGNNQPTSAVKSAELIWQLGHCSFPPLRLLLGSFAVDSIRDRLKSIIEEIEDWKHLNFPPIEGQEPEPDDEHIKDNDVEEDEDIDQDQDYAKEEKVGARHGRGSKMDTG